jgi:5-methylcytosine-specific restriction endonuclease McrA
MDDFSRRSDARLLAELDSLASCEREALPGFLARLAEVERRGLHLDAGYRSLFDYCVVRLKLSEGAAYQRVYASRACSRRPELFARIRDGELNLSAVARLAPYLSGDHAQAVIERACGLRRRELDALIAALARQGDSPIGADETGPGAPESAHDEQADLDFSPRAESATAGGIADPVSGTISDSIPADRAGADGEALRLRARDQVRHRAPGEVRIAFSADEALLGRLELARALLGRRHDGRIESVLALVLDDYIARHDPSRWGATVRARPRATAAMSRRVPRAVKAAVWRRDGGRCAFVAADGTRCMARERLEYDHVRAWALGGRSDEAANIRLLCRAHNLRAARKVFGPRVPAGGRGRGGGAAPGV